MYEIERRRRRQNEINILYNIENIDQVNSMILSAEINLPERQSLSRPESEHHYEKIEENRSVKVKYLYNYVKEAVQTGMLYKQYEVNNWSCDFYFLFVELFESVWDVFEKPDIFFSNLCKMSRAENFVQNSTYESRTLKRKICFDRDTPSIFSTYALHVIISHFLFFQDASNRGNSGL